MTASFASGNFIASRRLGELRRISVSACWRKYIAGARGLGQTSNSWLGCGLRAGRNRPQLSQAWSAWFWCAVAKQSVARGYGVVLQCSCILIGQAVQG